MPSALAQIVTVVVALVACVTLWRSRGPGDARSGGRDAKAIMGAWWDERRLSVGLVGAGLVALAVFVPVDAIALTLVLGAWTLVEQARALRAAGHRADALTRLVGAGVLGTVVAAFGIVVAPFDGVFVALAALAAACVSALRALRRQDDAVFRSTLRAGVPMLFFVPVLFFSARVAPWPQTTLDDVVAEAEAERRVPPGGRVEERLLAHLDAAGVPYDRDGVLERWRARVQSSTRARETVRDLEPLVRLGAETSGDVELWRTDRGPDTPDEFARVPVELLMAARHGPTAVPRDELAGIALDRDDADAFLDDALLTHDVLEALGDGEALATFRDAMHARLVALWVPRPAGELSTFARSEATAQEARTEWTLRIDVDDVAVSDAVAMMRRVGVPDGVDIPSLVRALDRERRERQLGRGEHLAAAALAELATWPEARVGPWRLVVRHRALLAALVVAAAVVVGARAR